MISKVLSEFGIKYEAQFKLDNVIPNRIRAFIDFRLIINGNYLLDRSEWKTTL